MSLKNLMANKYLRTTLVLAGICAVAAILLATVNVITTPYINAYEANKITAALEVVANGNEIGPEISVGDATVDYMHELYSNGQLVGYILGLNTRGYGGDITLIASFNTDGSVANVNLVSNSETPGVGKKAENEGYMDKFLGTGTSSKPVPTTKSMLSEVDSAAVSGATMTFTGISSALKTGSDYVKSLSKEATK